MWHLLGISYRLIAKGIAGACVPAMMDDGRRLVAILNPDNDAIIFGFGKDEHGYFVFDREARPPIEAYPSVDEIFAIFK